ncbi:NAD(P) transhydrogenase subunit alpha [Desulfuromusa kysingii]|uniref:proton-translocating NAD(P)(+) transhydrogenase n=1 Tax=Desulfuromusa kysingii TaxID=37625 RepID=A0A1H4C8M4_9BACT|nr:NAD(P) transhydrogenase subunit alpha [Desulfuromusa kysingii]SEA56696.1 NAD(P) transhydrogenase subunit alpha [Desulfuromusa kysingii]
MLIAIPKEILAAEKRVAVTPEIIKKYIDLGFTVSVEAGAGEGVFISDDDYRNAGATIETDVEKLCGQADVVLKVKQPIFNEQKNKHEVDMYPDDSILITFLHPAAPGSHEMVRRLQKKNITALTMDGIPRISRAQRMDALSSMSAVTGYKSVVMAADTLPVFIPMIGTAIGTIKPATFLVIGAGVVGLQAIATAKRLGAVVKVLDIRKTATVEGDSLGAKIIDFDIPQELVTGRGGYAKSLDPDWLAKEQQLIASVLKDIDVVILSALVPGEVAPLLITAEMVAMMKPGSVIIDVSVDQGGNCALTEPGTFMQKHGVNLCGIQNIPGRMAVHSSWLYANNLYYFVENLFKKGLDKLDLDDEIVTSSLVTYQSKIVHEGALKAMK